MNTEYIKSLADEILLALTKGHMHGKFTLQSGEEVEGITVSDCIKHLTSSRDYVEGRKFRFPGTGNGWNLESRIEAAGFRIVNARNRRNQPCNIVTL